MSGAYNIYGYEPSEAGAWICVALFSIGFISITALNVKFRSWFMIVISVAAVMELIGFAMRPDSAYSVGRYVGSVLMILLAPTIFAMADYSLIAILMKKFDIKSKIFKPNVVRYVFLFGDVFSFVLQCAGGGMTAISDQDIAKQGSYLLLAGLSVSLVVFVFFLVLCVYIHFQMRNNSDFERKWHAIFFILYMDMVLLIIRSTYRVAEYGNLEYHNDISTNETLFYCLDALEMLLLNFLWIPFHPGFWGLLDQKEESDVERRENIEPKNSAELA